MGVTYEFHADATLPGLERLWREATDWGEHTLDALGRWFAAAPFGKPRIVVANNSETGEMVGQFRFMPARVCVDGAEVRAVRPFGTIITPAMREAIGDNTNPLDQPAVAMYSRAVEELRAAGEQLIYMVPDPRWVRLFRMFDFLQTGSFPLWSLPLPLAAPLAPPDSYTAAPLDAWDARVDRLWEKFSRLHGCTGARDAATLRWKLTQANYTTTAVERAGELVGLVASRKKGDRQWLVCDLLAADAGESMRATLAAVVNVAHEKSLDAAGAEAIHKVAVLATPLMEPCVRDLGFARDDYDFPIAVHILDESIEPETVAPSRWYVSAND
ncbi:MAG TPA: hypothetical protein VNA19_00270 [Pyrinomonadaceae bacterium]|jgi:hypothetical protein|nr:hypothetical protein [Pyrinomonadaceae bacterium]